MSDSGSVELRCEVCGRPMVERQNRLNGSSFMGCAGYPECTNTAPVPAYVEMLRQGATLLPGMDTP